MSYDFNFCYTVNQLDKAMEKINNRIEEKLISDDCTIVIYTNGAIGQFAREYVQEEWGAVVDYTIDNITYDGEKVVNLSQAASRDNRNNVFLICSDNLKFYSEIREKIYAVFPVEQIIDVFPVEFIDIDKIEDVITELRCEMERVFCY